MDVFHFVLAIIAIAIGIPVISGRIAGYHKRKLALHGKQLELATRQAAKRAARYAAHGAELEQRVRVLERIATDRGIDIAEEIERLRDRPSPVAMRSN